MTLYNSLISKKTNKKTDIKSSKLASKVSKEELSNNILTKKFITFLENYRGKFALFKNFSYLCTENYICIMIEQLSASLAEFWTTLCAGMTVTSSLLLIIGGGIISLLFVYLIRIHIAYRMAVNRNRDPLGWVLLSFFFSPLLTWIVLLLAGNRR